MKALFNDQKLYKTNDLQEIICTLFLNYRINRNLVERAVVESELDQPGRPLWLLSFAFQYHPRTYCSTV